MEELSARDPGRRLPGSGIEPFEPARERLRRLLIKRGILAASDTVRLRSRTGRPMSWLLYTPALTMTAEGGALIGRCLLHALKGFTGTQLAAYGYTGLPVMTAALTCGEGRYQGLVVRDPGQSRGGGAVEGGGRRPGPVVVVDDSLVSGTAFSRAASLLEQDGFLVEGLVCLVEFPGRGGRPWAEAAGYRVEAVFDLMRDLGMSQTEVVDPALFSRPARAGAVSWPMMQPITLARRITESWPGLDEEAEQAADQTKPGSCLGALISFRDRATGQLVARDGFAAPSNPPMSAGAYVTAATKTVMRRAGSSIKGHGLDRLGISVVLIQAAEEIAPTELDAEIPMLILQGLNNRDRISLLPCDGRKRAEIALYLRARKMAGLARTEADTIYRCSVQELAEQGTARSCTSDVRGKEIASSSLVAALAGIARAEITGNHPDPPREHVAAPGSLSGISGVGVAFYSHGRLLGCWLSWGYSPAPVARRAAAHAWGLSGRAQATVAEAQDTGVLITFLHNPRHFGRLSPEVAATAFDLGVETLVATSGNRSASVFPHFVCHYGWSGEQTAQLAIRKAGIAHSEYPTWSAYRTTSWLDGPSGLAPIEHGFPARPGPALDTVGDFRRSAREVAAFIASQVGPDGLPAYQYHPVTDTVGREGPIGRIIFALDALAEAAVFLENRDWLAVARTGLRRCADRLAAIDGQANSSSKHPQASAVAECELLAALMSWLPEMVDDPVVAALSANVRGLFKPDGMISDLQPGFRTGTDHDILPGVAIVALGQYVRRAGLASELPALGRQLGWYRRRFRLLRPWAMIGWQMQGWATIADLATVPDADEFVFELANWASSRQVKDGAFLTELAPDGPSFHTAYIAEGVAEAWRRAAEVGQTGRAERYAGCWQRGMNFMQRLIIEESDSALLPNPGRAVGAVRPSLTDARTRIDYAAHLLRALVRGVNLIS
jgi:orotate phosphoribosyltransferase